MDGAAVLAKHKGVPTKATIEHFRDGSSCRCACLPFRSLVCFLSAECYFTVQILYLRKAVLIYLGYKAFDIRAKQEVQKYGHHVYSSKQSMN